MDPDRFIRSRAEGYDPQLIWLLSEEQRKKIAQQGSYQQSLFAAIFGRTLPPQANMSSWLPPADDQHQYTNIATDESRTLIRLSESIPNSPVLTFDMPGVANDYYVHSVAVCISSIAVNLGNVCYLVQDIASPSRRIKPIFERGEGTFGLACVEWINQTTIAVGYERSSKLYCIDITGRQEPKCQNALQHIALGQLTRITRLSDTAFLTGYKNGEVVYNDRETGESRSLLGMRRSGEVVCAIVPSNRAKHVAVGYNDGTINVYELTSQKTFVLVRSYLSTISSGKRAIAWLPGSDMRFLCGGGGADSVLRLFTLLQAEELASYILPYAVTNIVFTDNRQFVATYGNRIGHFILGPNKITPIKDVITSSNERLLDAAYSPQTGLIISSAGEFLSLWPPIPPQSSQDQKKASKLLVIR